MKTITKLLFLLCFLATAQMAYSQWSTGVTWTGADPRIQNTNPDLEFRNTSTTGISGLDFKTNTTTEAYMVYDHGTNEFRFTDGPQVAANSLFSIDTDNNPVTGSANGYINIGAITGAHLSSDGNEIQAKNGSAGNSTLFLNFWGADTRINTGNNLGDLFVGQGNDLFVDNSAGRVAIGTTAADQKLQVQHTGSDGIKIEGNNTGDSRLSIENGGGTHFIFDDDSDGHHLDIQSANEINFMTNGAIERMTIAESGRVGIGTGAPVSALHVVGNDMRLEENFPFFYLNSPASGNQGIIFQEGGSNRAWMWHDRANNALRLTNGSSTANHFNIRSTGRIGIGTLDPLSDVHIADAGEVAGLIIERTDQANYVNLLSGTTGNSFYFARAKRFSIVPSGSITSTSPNVPNSLFMYGPSWTTAAQRGNTGIGTDAPTEKLHVAGNLRVNSTVITSDRRLKSDIQEFEYGLDEVRQLNPVHFTYNGRGATTAGSKHIGLIAQELQAIAPELVEEFTHVLYEYDEDGTQREVGSEQYLQIRDTEVKYMLMNSIKQMAEDNEAKDERIEALETELDAMKAAIAKIEAKLGGTTVGTVNPTDSEVNAELNGEGTVAALAQNNPNPFSENTMIPYFLPEGTTGAHMNIFSAEGKLLKTIKIDETGKGQVNLRTNGLPSGNYMYQLATDAGVVGSKTMVLAK